jgi:glutamate:GABA antiporter
MVTIVYVLIFPAVIRLRYKYPDVPRPYRIPGGTAGLWIAGILTTAWAALTTVAIIYPGIGTSNPDSSLPSGFEGERLQYTLSQVIPLVVMILLGLILYVLGRRTRQQPVPEFAAATAAAGAQAPDAAAGTPGATGASEAEEPRSPSASRRDG